MNLRNLINIMVYFFKWVKNGYPIREIRRTMVKYRKFIQRKRIQSHIMRCQIGISGIRVKSDEHSVDVHPVFWIRIQRF